ncbi:MAG: hypothetical protein JWL59_145 [Chthoniobacteraceae bacterium]|nr:hypothetical protein [Chthoniobacteraceae bacterium]
MLSNFLLILGIAILSLSLRQFRPIFFQKLSALGILATSFLTGWLMTGYWIAGLFCALSWFILPWVEILTRVRKLSLPVERDLARRHAPNREAFPALSELTEEIEEEGFEHLDDCGWEMDDYEQFFRLFYKDDERIQGAICLIEQHRVGFYYLSLSSRAKDGRIWTTWNYPFSYSLKLLPQWKVNRLRGDKSFLELYLSHCDFLRANGIQTEELHILDSERIHAEIQGDMRAQLQHNISAGVLTETSSGQVRYSWRGLFFIWFQFMRDLVWI